MHVRSLVLSLGFCAPNAIIWCQQPAMPENTGTPITARAVMYHGPQGDVVLRASFLFPRADPHVFFVRTDRRQAVVSEGRVHILEATPSLAVQGFGPGTDWALVKLERHDGVDMIRVPSRSRWGPGFFSDEPFSREDVVAVTQSGAGDVYTLRPTVPLQSGAYVLCGRPAVDQGGWGRVCYDFEIGGGS